MLVLTRKVGEEIRIDNDIVVKVTAVQGGRVKLGIDAPRSRKITRPEAATPAPKATTPAGGLAYASAAR